MLITSKTQYALKLMIDIAANSDGAVTVKAASKRCGLSNKYLEQVAAILLRAGLLKSTRGAKGGYRLAKSEDEITVGMIFRTVEIGMFANQDEDEDEATDVLDSVVNEVCCSMEDAVNSVLDNVTIGDLKRKFVEKAEYMYYI